jgi:hypothetical protein
MLFLWLDDERPPPSQDWLRVKTAPEAIKALETTSFQAISLDHDLGVGDVGTGYDVLKYLEEKVYTDPEYRVPEIKIHTDNVVARRRMAQTAESIERLKLRARK